MSLNFCTNNWKSLIYGWLLFNGVEIVKLQRTGALWNRDNRNGINSNWERLESLLDVINKMVVEGKMSAAQYSQVITTLNGLIKKGEVSVSDIDKNKGKLDQTYLSDELLQQMAGNTPINAVPADGSITTEKLGVRSVTEQKLDYNSVTSSRIADGSVSAPKIMNGSVFRSKLADNFLHNGRVTNDVPLKEILNDGLYIVNHNNIEGYPEGAPSNRFYRLEVQRTEGWVKQSLSELENPSIAYTRFVGASSGNTSDWAKMVVGKIDTDDIADGSITPGKLSMNILDIQRKPLKIFMVGNSFALDTCDYLHHMCAEVKADVTIGVTYLQNANLEAHYNNFISENAVYNYHEYTSIDGVASKSISNGLSLQAMLNKHNDWDLITFQQQSTLSDDYATYQPHLNSLIEGIKSVIQNNPKIGMLQTWANSTTKRPDQIGMYNGLVDAYEKAIADEGIGVFIPAGTAIQSARTNQIMNEEANELTRDGYHLSPLGKYVAGLTMFESIFSGYYKREILSDINYTPEGISDYQVYKAKLAAKNAVLSPMKIMEL